MEAYREQRGRRPPSTCRRPLDGSRPGQYYLNTLPARRQRQLHKIASITFHEATPGHHFQIAIEQELTGLPAFRRLGSRMAGAAYVEGWGLYAERLADEMGLYSPTPSGSGMLDAQSFRAARLVVDSGLHAFGWTREPRDRVHARARLAAAGRRRDRGRPIHDLARPGAALQDRPARDRARTAPRCRAQMGERFDLRAFHDEVLAHGTLPLATLRREIPTWVEAAVAEGR